jgi:hypothetical protein
VVGIFHHAAIMPAIRRVVTTTGVSPGKEGLCATFGSGCRFSRRTVAASLLALLPDRALAEFRGAGPSRGTMIRYFTDAWNVSASGDPAQSGIPAGMMAIRVNNQSGLHS